FAAPDERAEISRGLLGGQGRAGGPPAASRRLIVATVATNDCLVSGSSPGRRCCPRAADPPARPRTRLLEDVDVSACNHGHPGWQTPTHWQPPPGRLQKPKNGERCLRTVRQQGHRPC